MLNQGAGRFQPPQAQRNLKMKIEWTDGGHKYRLELEIGDIKNHAIDVKHRCLKDDKEIPLEELQKSYEWYLKESSVRYE